MSKKDENMGCLGFLVGIGDGLSQIGQAMTGCGCLIVILVILMLLLF